MAKAEKEEKVDLHLHHLLVNAKTIKVSYWKVKVSL